MREARKLGIVTIGIIDTDSDPDTVDVVIPANDDSIRAISLILNELADAVAVGKTMVSVHKEVAARPKRPARPRRTALARTGEPAAAESGSTRLNQRHRKPAASRRRKHHKDNSTGQYRKTVLDRSF